MEQVYSWKEYLPIVILQQAFLQMCMPVPDIHGGLALGLPSETSGMLKGVAWNAQGPQNTRILPCPRSHFSLTYPRKHKASEYTKLHCSGDKSKGGIFVHTKDKCDFPEYFL